MGELIKSTQLDVGHAMVVTVRFKWRDRFRILFGGEIDLTLERPDTNVYNLRINVHE